VGEEDTNCLKVKTRYDIGYCKFSFDDRVYRIRSTGKWTHLPRDVVSSSSVNIFK